MEVGVLDPNQYIEQTGFHRVGMGSALSLMEGWHGNAGIESSDPSTQNGQENMQNTSYTIFEAHAVEDYQTAEQNDGGPHPQTIGMQGQLTLDLIWNQMNENFEGGETFEGTEVEVILDAESAVRVSDMSLSRVPPPEPP